MQSKASNFSFGVVFTLLFAAITAFSYINGGSWYPFFGLAATLLLIVTLTKSHLLAPFNKVWTKFGEFLHCLVSPIILGIIYFGVLAPTSIFLRIKRHDPLRLKRDETAQSYWISREQPGPTGESLTNQY